MPRAVVLVVDGLSAPYLGPYGNTWLETPAFNRLAAESLLWETVLIHDPDLLRGYDAYWPGSTKTSPGGFPEDAASGEAISLFDRLHARDVAVHMLSSDRRLQQHPLFEQIDHFDDLALIEEPSELADEMESTELARFFANALDAWQQMDDSSLLWLHSTGMEGPWDAPYELRAQFADEDDPEPLRDPRPPRFRLENDQQIDPDVRHRLMCGYAGQISLLDACFEIFLQAIRNRKDTLLIVTSTGGYPLGEHRSVGRSEGHLYRELLHVPLLARWPGGYLAGERRLRVTSPALVSDLLDAWFVTAAAPTTVSTEIEIGTGSGSVSVSGDSGRSRHPTGRPTWRSAREDAAAQGVLVSRHGAEMSIRTQAWFARIAGAIDDLSQQGSDRPVELYLKPDDAWEVNDVADRCPDVVQAMRELARQLAREPLPLDERDVPLLLQEGQI